MQNRKGVERRTEREVRRIEERRREERRGEEESRAEERTYMLMEAVSTSHDKEILMEMMMIMMNIIDIMMILTNMMTMMIQGGIVWYHCTARIFLIMKHSVTLLMSNCTELCDMNSFKNVRTND